MRYEGCVIIGDHNQHMWRDPVVEGTERKRGLIPRNYVRHPLGSYRSIKSHELVDMPLIEDVAGRLKELREGKALLSDVRKRGNPGMKKPIPSRDQNGRGYCWQHSGVSCMMIIRARDGQPYADLSAYGPACREKNFADEGGWGAQGVQNLIDWGCPTSKTWPQQGTKRSYDTPATWEEASHYKIDEGWVDLSHQDYDRNLTWAQFVTCWLAGHPTVNDYNWWSHSVCGLDPVDGKTVFAKARDADSGKRVQLKLFEHLWSMDDPVTAGMGCLIWNSWGDSWSDDGMGILTPQKAVPDGGVACRTTTLVA
jgi:hypothetical protein